MHTECNTAGMLATFFIFFEITINAVYIGFVADQHKKIDPSDWFAVFMIFHLVYYAAAGLVTLFIYAVYGCYLARRYKPRIELMEPLMP